MDNFISIKRPKPGDDEEELIRMQEEFLRKKQEPSAKVVNVRAQAGNISNTSSQRCEPSTGKTQSKFSQQKRLKMQDRISTSNTIGPVVNPAIKDKLASNVDKEAQNLNDNTTLIPSNVILGNIVEKKHSSSKYEFELNSKTTDSLDTGFSSVFVSDCRDNKRDSKQSIFMQNISKKKELLNKSTNVQSSAIENENSSTIVEGSRADKIHKANIEKISLMTPEEILKEKQRLEATLNPEIIRFLRNRKEKKQKSSEEKSKKEKTNKNQTTTESMDCSSEATAEPMDYI